MKTDSKFNYWAIVPAAGVGKRMGSAIPKQYLTIDGSTILDLTLGRLLGHPSITGVYIAISSNDGYWPESSYFSDERITVVPGGTERCHSVLNALQVLKAVADENDRVLVHDAARPCVRPEDITSLIKLAGKNEDGGILGVPVKDTMKRTDAGNNIQKTLERTHMWHAFTPQLFPVQTLYSALQQSLDKGQLVTDEASAMELAAWAEK